MRRLLIMVVLIVVGIEGGKIAFDALERSVQADYAELKQNVEEMREY